MTNNPPKIVVRALHTHQGAGIDLYAFFIKGGDIVRVADISRIERDTKDALKGFQRPEIRNHVKGIVEYLSHGNVLFPNAIILAMGPEVRFVASRGTKPSGDEGIAETGTLTIPIYDEGHRVAWIVDGQQRSIALSEVSNRDLPVPVVGFVSDDLKIQREQFILVNKARPLPSRLINELLPETGSFLLPRDLSSRRLPAELCDLLNRDPASPFYKLIKRPSDRGAASAVVTDTAVITMIRNSLGNPLGSLAPYKPVAREGADVETMYRILITFWNSVKSVFPAAWGIDSRQSRLMHSAGIEAMGVLMDRIYGRLTINGDDAKFVREELERIAPHCRWTEGTWESIGVKWNEIQSTPRDIKRLQDALIRSYSSAARR
jgi:DGQHR domain-containing protein